MAEQVAGLEELSREVDTTLALGDGKKINICYALFKIIEKVKPDQQPALLRHVAESFDESESSHELKIGDFISDNEKDQLKKKYGDLVDEMLDMLLNENPQEDHFYKSLWEMLHNPIFGDEKSRIFALYYVLIDRRIPYFHLEAGFKMSNEDWRSTSLRLRRERAKIRFILASHFSQRSEEGDLILKELDRAQTYEDKISLIGYMLFELRTREKLTSVLDQALR